MFKKREFESEEAKSEFEQLYPEIHNGMFIPCGHKKKALLYVKFTYQGIEQIIIHNFRNGNKLVIPDDIL
jgi:hypothetical protein